MGQRERERETGVINERDYFDNLSELPPGQRAKVSPGAGRHATGALIGVSTRILRALAAAAGREELPGKRTATVPQSRRAERRL